jgi:hypothetical protein
METKFVTIPTIAKHLAVIRADADRPPTFDVRRHAAGGDVQPMEATIIMFRRRPSMAQKALAPAQSKQPPSCDTNHSEAEPEPRYYAAKRLRDALTAFRKSYGSEELATILEMKLTEERRLIARAAPAIQPDSAARSCYAILRVVVEQLIEAEGVAKKGGLTQIAGWLHERHDSLSGELMQEVKGLVAMLEAEARKS